MRFPSTEGLRVGIIWPKTRDFYNATKDEKISKTMLGQKFFFRWKFEPSTLR